MRDCRPEDGRLTRRRCATQQAPGPVVCEQLAEHIDPAGSGKTLIFAASDAHADMVVGALGAAMEARHGPQDEALIRKITGSVDRPGAMIRR